MSKKMPGKCVELCMQMSNEVNMFSQSVEVTNSQRNDWV